MTSLRGVLTCKVSGITSVQSSKVLANYLEIKEYEAPQSISKREKEPKMTTVPRIMQWSVPPVLYPCLYLPHPCLCHRVVPELVIAAAEVGSAGDSRSAAVVHDCAEQTEPSAGVSAAAVSYPTSPCAAAEVV